MKFLKIFSWFALVVMTIGLGYLFGSATNHSMIGVQAQDGQKNIKLARTIKPQLKFSEVKVGEQQRTPGENFNAAADWVNNLSFKLENIADKPIVYLRVNVNFPETRTSGNMASYSIGFGIRPDSKSKTADPLLLNPGETLDVALNREKEKISKFVSERQPLESIQKVELEIGYIIFEDKTAWAAGTFLKQDPDNPSRYNPIINEDSRPNQEEE